MGSICFIIFATDPTLVLVMGFDRCLIPSFKMLPMLNSAGLKRCTSTFTLLFPNFSFKLRTPKAICNLVFWDQFVKLMSVKKIYTSA